MVELTAEAWEEKYQKGQDRWDLGCPAPPLINLLASTDAPQPGRIAVLGCGSGQDAMLFATAGFEVVGFDFAPSALKRARDAANARNLNVKFVQRNIFKLEADFQNHFDYVLEHTCFCAIDVSLRFQYVKVVKEILRPNGMLIALFYTGQCSESPPFGIKPKSILDIFAPEFNAILFKTAKDSISRHKRKEHLVILKLRSV